MSDVRVRQPLALRPLALPRLPAAPAELQHSPLPAVQQRRVPLLPPQGHFD